MRYICQINFKIQKINQNFKLKIFLIIKNSIGYMQ